MMHKAQLRISSLGDGPHIGNDTTIEVRKNKDSEWIDISAVVNDVNIKLTPSGVVEALLKVYPSSVALDVIADLEFYDDSPQQRLYSEEVDPRI